jgi:hypothetical protein
MKTIYLTILLLLCSIAVWCQQKKIDSLQQVKAGVIKYKADVDEKITDDMAKDRFF